MREFTIKDAFKALEEVDTNESVKYVPKGKLNESIKDRKCKGKECEKSIKEGKFDDERFLGEFTFQGKEYSVRGELSHTRDYNWEEVRIEDNSDWNKVVGYGKYKWMNRPWYRFQFAEAFRTAFINAFGSKYKSFIDELIDKSGSVKEVCDLITNSDTTDSGEEKDLKEAPEYELRPGYDSRNSFYGKAIVDTGRDNDKNKLYSYGTLVAEIKDGKPVVYGTYSATTLRHIKDWLKQNGFKADSLNQIRTDYMDESCKGKDYKSKKSVKEIYNARGMDYYEYPIGSGCHIREVPSGFIATNENGTTLGETSLNKAGAETQIDEYIKNKGRNKKLKESQLVDITDGEEIKKAKELIKDGKKEEEEVTQVVDVDASTVDELKDSYIGNVILQCPVCRTLIYKKPDAINKDEEDEDSVLYNKEEECPHCGSKEGFDLIGQVATLDVEVEEPVATTGTDIEQDKEEVKVEDEVKEEPVKDEDEIEIKDEEEFKFENFDEKKFNGLVNKYLTKINENFKSFRTTNAYTDNRTHKVVVEGNLRNKSGEVSKSRFIFEFYKKDNNKIVFKGLNESFTKSKESYRMTAKIENDNLICESLRYNYSDKLNESKKVLGRVSIL